MKSENIKWQPIVELIIVLVTVLGSTITLYVHTDNKMHAQISEMREEVSVQNARTDKLYEMFIDLLKETRNER